VVVGNCRTKVGVDVSPGPGLWRDLVGNCEGVEVGTVVGPGLGGGAEGGLGVSRFVGVELEASPGERLQPA
jgi:hypothetical protein